MKLSRSNLVFVVIGFLLSITTIAFAQSDDPVPSNFYLIEQPDAALAAEQTDSPLQAFTFESASAMGTSLIVDLNGAYTYQLPVDRLPDENDGDSFTDSFAFPVAGGNILNVNIGVIHLTCLPFGDQAASADFASGLVDVEGITVLPGTDPIIPIISEYPIPEIPPCGPDPSICDYFPELCGDGCPRWNPFCCDGFGEYPCCSLVDAISCCPDNALYCVPPIRLSSITIPSSQSGQLYTLNHDGSFAYTLDTTTDDLIEDAFNYWYVSEGMKIFYVVVNHTLEQM